MAPSVVNKGAIIATGGRIALSGADRATVSLNGGLFEFAVPSGAQGTNATINNLAGARLEGARILLSTGDAANLVSGVINLEGVQQASSAIVVDGNTVVLKSDLDAGASGTISGSSNTIQVHDTASIQDAVSIAKTGTAGAGATVELQAGTFNQQVDLTKANMTLRGVQSVDDEQLAKIVVPNSATTGIKVMANNVTVQGLEIEGPLTAAYSSLSTAQWNATPNSLGIFVNQNVTGFNITDNKIHDVRTGIRVFGTGNVGSISNNEFDNTKGGILFQYTNGTGVTMSGNREGSVGNEWGIGLNINSANPNTGDAPAEWQTSLLALANSNNQMAVEDRKYATSNRTRVIVDDDSTVTATDDFNLGNGLGNARQPLRTIESGINAVVKGGTVQVREGVYTLTSTLNVNKSVTLDGAGQSQTIIDGRSIAGNYGLHVTADNVTLSDFTLYGPSNDVGTAYGIKVSPGGSADARLRNFTIRSVTSRGAGRAELDLNGVDGALIDNVTLNGAPVGNDIGETKGAGLQLTDSANITVRNTTTRNNNWGGLAIYQANRSYNQRVNNISVEANNSFNEANPVYMQDESTLHDFGSLSIAGFDYAVRNAASASSSQYTWLQRTKQNAFDFAVNVPTASSSYIQGWSGAAATQTFEVGVGNLAGGGSQAMSISAAVDQAASGAYINVAAGTFVQTSRVEVDKAVTLRGVGEAQTLIDARGVAGNYGLYVTADNVTLGDFTVYGPSNGVGNAYGIKVAPSEATPHDANARLRNFTIRNVTSRGAGRAELDLNGVDGALIENVTLNGAPVGNDSGDTKGAGLQLTDSANVTVRNTTTLNNNWGGLALYQANTYYNQQVNNIIIEGNNRFNEVNPVYLQDQSASKDFGALSIAGFGYAVRNATNASSNQYTWLQATKQKAYDFAVNPSYVNASNNASAAYIQGWNGASTTQNFEVGVGNLAGGGTQAMTIATAIDQANSSGATINVGAGTYAQQFTLNKANLTLKGETGAKLEVPDLSVVNGVDAITITANNVTVEGMEIAGPINAPYYDYYATSKPNVSRGIVVRSGATGFTLRNNNIHDVRTGILIDGRNGTGNTVSGNRIENTKSGISVQYTDASGVTIANNREGAVGNEWGLNLHLNGHLNNLGNVVSNSDPIATAPTLEWQQSLLSLSKDNNGWTVQDQGYLSQNRTYVTVAKTPAGTNNQGSVLTPINTVQGGVNAVVQGGQVEVKFDTYAESVTVDRLMNLNFNDVTLRSLLFSSGSAGSGIGGKVTATGADGLVADGGLKLLADTTLATEGRKIELRGALQNSGSTAYNLTLATNAGNGNNRGDVTLHSGGADGNSLGHLSVTAKNFALDNTLWVRGYTVAATGDAALSNNTLRATAAGVTSSLAAGGNVTGSTTSAGSVVLAGGGVVSANVTAAAAATLTGREVRGSVSAATLTARADTAMNLALDVTNANLTAGTRADLSGRAGSATVEAKQSYFSGNFPSVDTKGTGTTFINGVPQRDEAAVPASVVIVRPPVIVLPPPPPPPPPAPPAPVVPPVSVVLQSQPAPAAGAPAAPAPSSAGAPGAAGGGTQPAATGGSGGSGNSGNSGSTGGGASSPGGNGSTASGSGSGEAGGSSSGSGAGSGSGSSSSSGGNGSGSGGASGGGSGGRSGGAAVTAGGAPRPVTVTRNAPGKAAGESLDRGQGVEVDLSPGRS